jgi:O-antigen ligase
MLVKRFNLDKTYQYLLISLAFLMPLTVSGANTIIVIICLFWLFSGDYKSKYNQIVNSKLMIASIIFFSIHAVSLIWSDDLLWGLHILHKMWYFLLFFPILFTIVQKKYINFYISAFLLAILITEIFSYLVWFQIIETFIKANLGNPTPFMSHVSYNPILAFSIYIVSHKVLFNKNLSNLMRCIYIFFIIVMTINMFITGGRAGQIMYFAALVILIFQFFDNQKFKSLLAILLLVPGVFYTAYQTSDLFHLRVQDVLNTTSTYQDNKGSGVGLRITFALNSWEVIKKNPIIGVGIGDFPEEYKRINLINTPELTNTSNPHSMYTLVLVQLGLLGFVSLLSIFYYEIKLSSLTKNKFIRDVGAALPLLFLLIMFSDSYLLGHFTTLMFVFFSSFLYKDFEQDQ